MKRLLLNFVVPLVLACFSFSVISAQTIAPSASYKMITGNDYVKAKNYYLLTLFENLPAVRKLLSSDSALVQLARRKNAALREAMGTCNRDAFCYTAQMKFSADEIKLVSNRLMELYTPNNALGALMTAHLLPSGAYILFAKLPPKEMLAKAWEQDAAGINFTISVYAEGAKANYPLIDSTSFNTKSPGYYNIIYNTVSILAEETKTSPSFFDVPLKSALYLLEMNEREQAGDYEPMTATVNHAAIEKIKTTNWKSYPYSVILVPGAGPDEPKVAFSAEGMLRCKLAAMQYANHDAPFIVVSGGKVHPYKTKFCEAEEMKKYLVEKLGVPASAVIMEPHARHTTTNMRNTVRLMFHYGIPFSMPGVTCTTRGQSTMIGVTLIDRCIKELQVSPYRNGKRLSETAIEFFPLVEALHINPTEPMDP